MHRAATARARVIVCFASLSGCVQRADLGGVETGGSGDTGSTTGDDTGSTTAVDPVGPAPVGPANVDILFVIDNSGSMAEEQAQLAASVDGLVSSLEGIQGISYRIGVTTTDSGNPWCGSTSPEAGALVATSCRQRTGQFVFNGNPPADATEIACTDICNIETIELAATAIAGDPALAVRPWIEGDGGSTNVQFESVGDALRCMLPQGVSGCGFEQPLESLHRAVQRMQTPGDPSYGFLRDEAHLAVIFVSDEVDCSYAAGEDWIFKPEDEGGTPTRFWTDPTSTAPTSAVCWNAGVVCDGPGDPGFESCRVANHSLEGSDVADAQAVLTPVGAYVDALTELLQHKRDVAGTSVFLYGVLGVPQGYPDTPIPFANSDDPQEQSDFGIAPGCQGPRGRAFPPLRQLAVIESFAYEGLAGSQVFSICEPEQGALYTQIVAQLAPYLGG